MQAAPGSRRSLLKGHWGLLLFRLAVTLSQLGFPRLLRDICALPAEPKLKDTEAFSPVSGPLAGANPPFPDQLGSDRPCWGCTPSLSSPSIVCSVSGCSGSVRSLWTQPLSLGPWGCSWGRGAVPAAVGLLLGPWGCPCCRGTLPAALHP